MSAPLLEVRNLRKFFEIRKGLLGRIAGHVRAVDDISFTVNAGETLGLVGESGCGKTTAGRTLLRLIPPSGGQALYEGRDVFEMGPEELRALRQKMQIIFQDPYGSLNPRRNVQDIVGEALEVHGLASGAALRDRVLELVEQVGLKEEHLSRYPHEFSGGQRQRIGIARALALDPRFIVCDEAVSALDVSIQAQVINLLLDLQQQRGLAYLFIAHDLSVVRHISDRIAVMYLGKIVEMTTSEALFRDPRHPYTRALLSAIPLPRPGARRRKRLVLSGDVPNPINPPPGCAFHPRCPFAVDRCRSGDSPPAIELSPGHVVACHLAADGSLPAAPELLEG